MRLREHYDWIVVGNHPSALLSGCLAARMGLAVLILPLNLSLRASMTPSGRYFDPEPNYLLGLTESDQGNGLLYECLKHIGLEKSDKDRIRPFAPQVLTPDSRFALFRGEAFQKELIREFGQKEVSELGLLQASKITEKEYLSFWNHLPKRLTLRPNRKPSPVEPMSLREVDRNIFKKHSSANPSAARWLSGKKSVSEFNPVFTHGNFQEISEGIWHAISAQLNPDPLLNDFIHLLSLSGVSGLFEGGLTHFREFLLESAKRLGAFVSEQVECRRIFIEKGRLIGIQIENQGNMISTTGGILGCPVEYADQRLSYTGKSWISRKKEALSPTGWRFTIALTVNQECIPVGMHPRAIWQERGAPPLEIEAVDLSSFQFHDPDSRILYLRTILPYHLESLSVDYQTMIAARMFRQAMKILPFLDFHVRKIFPDFRETRGLASVLNVGSESSSEPIKNVFSELYPFTSLQQVPDNLLIYEGDGLGSSLGIEGLFLASGESYPMLGNHGATVAAVESVAWLAHRLGISGPFSTG